MKLTDTTAILLAALGLTACAPVVAGGPPLALSPERAAGSRIDAIYFSNDWVRAEEDFSDDVTDELLVELARCTRGRSPLRLHVHVDDAHRENRLETVVNGGGEHWIAGVAEFVEPRAGAVVGRYPFRVSVDAGGPLQAVLANRQVLLGRAVGRTLCREAFGAR